VKQTNGRKGLVKKLLALSLAVIMSIGFFGAVTASGASSDGNQMGILVEPSTVTGLVRTYNPANPTTLKLMQGNAVMYTTTIPATTGFGQVTQPFTFAGVAPGRYDLAITKPAHTSFTVQGIVVVSNTNLDLTKDSREAVRCMTLLCGDINGDNMINSADVAVLWQASNYNKSAGSAANKLCDLDGDGMVNNVDLSILWRAGNYNKGAVVVGGANGGEISEVENMTDEQLIRTLNNKDKFPIPGFCKPDDFGVELQDTERWHEIAFNSVSTIHEAEQEVELFALKQNPASYAIDYIGENDYYYEFKLMYTNKTNSL
jgi:hypothetical protein